MILCLDFGATSKYYVKGVYAVKRISKILISLISAAVLLFMTVQCLAYEEKPEGVPSAVETAVLNKVEVLNDNEGVPYFALEVKFPQSFLELSRECPGSGYTWIDYYWSIDGGAWDYLGGGVTDSIFDASYGNAVEGSINTYRVSSIYPEDEGSAAAIIIKDHKYTIRVQLSYFYYPDGANGTEYISSGFSNELTIGSGSFYKKASEWAKTELEKADELGLVPDILIGADMTKPITREEFCELAVLLYEKATMTAAEPVSDNPFKDTTNTQILKAYKLGITTGTSATEFSPSVLINREQCAAMLFRTIKAINPDGNYSTDGVKDFPDQKHISDWAVQAAKYMSGAGILTGDKDGNFMPKAVTSAQEASGYGMATREQAVALSVRTFSKTQNQ
jgi:hypothetical protein